ncbi:MAG: PQQ-binding-like beta-propeller repeat protein [Thiohalophilus sp.]|uniref:YVTN family beta-propeller repeat protein n=1 Tax=Thiohalophilus sp. TaxID=3028392 RepID=UPI002870481C|nr:PQQ-binding-like beta-propeller repeat protein [Thiohalophilus sp.]MDR9437034.1 PQQ-binding-like beta-propeller repeat protein [Thiohalophilus sp.]
MIHSLSRALTMLFILLGGAATAFASPTVYIPLGSANQVIAVDAKTHRITAKYANVTNPHGLVATPDGEYLVAGSLAESAQSPDTGPDEPTSKLYLIHPAHGHVMQTIPVAGWSHHQAITPDGRYVISTHATRGDVSVLDMTTNQIVRRIPTGPAPNYTLITRDGRRAYVSNSGDGTITEIDLNSWKPLRTLEGGASPEHMVFSTDEQTFYVTNPRIGKVAAISVASGKLVRTYEIGPDTHGLDIGDDGKTLFVTSKKAATLSAVNTESGEIRSVSLEPAPYHLNTIPDTGTLYVSSRGKPVIWVIDQQSLKVIKTIDLPGGEGHQMAIVK